MASMTPTRERRDPCRFLSAISSAFFEWMLITLLFLDALFSYLVIKFSSYCKLPAPCLLCSRFDRVFGIKKPNNYSDLICNAHKLEISLSGYCRKKERLSSSSVGKHVEDLDDGKYGEDMIKVPLLKKDCDQLFYIGYRELKDTSDSESEFPFSDNDDADSLACGSDNIKEECVSQCLQSGRAPTVYNDSAPEFADDDVVEKLIYPEASLSLPERNFEVRDSHSNGSVRQDLEDIDWSQDEVKSNPAVSSEVTSDQVRDEALNSKRVPENGDGSLDGEVTKSFTSTDTSSRFGQITNEKRTAVGREISRVPEDLKQRLSQISAPRWPDFPWNDMIGSPIVQGDDSRLSDASSSTGILSQAKKFFVDKYELGLESLDASLISDLEGETAVDRLKQQIEMDRKFMSALYKELEEERSASAIAANQAMAMITRLQEEKASMQMEALQYLRMMEEQSEYDQEAIQNLNELLADREKDLQDFEAEIESYRQQFGNEAIAGKILEPSIGFEKRECTPVSTPRLTRLRGRENGSDLVKNAVLGFEEEKAYISGCLQRLEKKLQLVSSNVVHAVGSEVDAKAESLPHESPRLRNDEYPKDSSIREGMIVSEKDSSTTCDDDLNVKTITTPRSTQNLRYSFKEALLRGRSRSSSFNETQLNDTIVLGNEVSQLNARLEAIEADRSLLETAVKLLRNGSDGLQFIQEIACHLQEIRKIGSTHRDHVVD